MSTGPQVVPAYDPFAVASGGFESVLEDWMPASQCRPLIQEDPCTLWLEWYGEKYGLMPSKSDYSFNDFLSKKGKELEAAWLGIYAKNSVRVCQHDGDARLAKTLKITLEMMSDGCPVILHPALWWAPERIYGVPDLIVLSTWLEQNFPHVLPPAEVNAGSAGKRHGHYVALDVKIRTQLDHGQNKEHLEITAAQLGMYSYMLGHLQMHMPQSTFAVCRDRVASPLRIEIKSLLNSAMDAHLVKVRDQWHDLRTNGSKYMPWKDEAVEVNLMVASEKWDDAKKTIVQEKVPGGCPTQLLKVSLTHKKVLAAAGFPSLQAMIDADPATIPFDQCKGIGKGKTATLLRAILEAQRTAKPVRPPASLVPSPKKFEFFVDYEFFQNGNFDCQKQWPTLQGCSMVFMAGIGFEEGGQFKCVQFVAESESQDQELKMFTDFLAFLDQQTHGSYCDGAQTAFYHWTHAEATQSKGAADNHQLPLDHPLRKLNWTDLNKVFGDGPAALPGCLDTGLKHIAKALGKLDPQYDPAWPEELAEGLGAMVMGWRSYAKPKPLDCMEMKCLQEYLEADCRALWQILRWLRT
jgi:hypothetical protein